jgi:multidrug resistance efflux pump
VLQDRFWRRFAITASLILLALILIPIMLLLPATFAYQKARKKPHPAREESGPLTQAHPETNQGQSAVTNTTPVKAAHNAEVERLKFDFAEKQLGEARKRYEAGVIPQLEYEKAKSDRDIALANLNGDSVEAARLALQFAETNLKCISQMRDVGKVSSAEYDEAKLARDIAAARWRQAKESEGSPASTQPRSSLDAQDDLREAKAKLAELRVSFGENHPAVQAQIKRVEELERLTREEPQAPADLREAKAKLAELRQSYSDQHPLVQALKARIKALEEK